MEQWILLAHKMTALIEEKNKEINKLRQSSRKLTEQHKLNLTKEKMSMKEKECEL